jgi:periplasmic protein TonB
MVTHAVVMAPLEEPQTIARRERRVQAARDTFISALLEVPCEYKHRNPLEWAVSLVVHVVVIAGLIIAPLYFTQALDLKAFQTTWLVAPAPPPPPPPPAVSMIERAVKSVARLMDDGRMIVPTAIPKQVLMIKDKPLPPEPDGPGVIGGVPGGIPGGEAGGVLGGIIGSAKNVLAPVAPPAPPVKRIVRIGGHLKPPRQIYAPQPQYPVIAKQAGIQGTVVIDAVIDEHGNVVQAHVLTGPPLLIPAAMQAVAQWRYQPTYLNGDAISVAMHVEVHFVLQ